MRQQLARSKTILIPVDVITTLAYPPKSVIDGSSNPESVQIRVPGPRFRQSLFINLPVGSGIVGRVRFAAIIRTLQFFIFYPLGMLTLLTAALILIYRLIIDPKSLWLWWILFSLAGSVLLAVDRLIERMINVPQLPYLTKGRRIAIRFVHPQVADEWRQMNHGILIADSSEPVQRLGW